MRQTWQPDVMAKHPRSWPRRLSVAATIPLLVGLLGTFRADAPSRRASTKSSAYPMPAAPAGIGVARRLPSLGQQARHAHRIGALRCSAQRRSVAAAHIELFARGHVVIVPA